MEDTFRASAIVLSSQPFREYDSRKVVYSLEKGKLDLVARGVKKIKSKLSAHLEPLSLSEIMVVRGRQFDYVGAAMSRNCYSAIKNNLFSLEAAGRAINVFNKLVDKEETEEEIFLLLKDFLDFLDQESDSLQSKSLEIWSDFFILKLLSLSGYKPEMWNCRRCQKKISPENNFFDLNRGGLVCGKCSQESRDIISVSDNCIKVLRQSLEKDFDSLKKLKIDGGLEREVGKIINSFYKYCL
jgi:DNA repair protein RecO (recombination protein O)